MNRFVINTANSDLIVAIDKDGELFSRVETNQKKHNEIVLDLVEKVLEDSGLTLSDIDEFGVVVGPGSFTGIRVGIATIKAFNTVVKARQKGVNNLAFLFELAKNKNVEIVAIEGSLNSFFVAEMIEKKLYFYPRNLTLEELTALANNREVGCFEISDFMKNSGIQFVAVEKNVEALFECLKNSFDSNLTPVYYQLSQAENDKINRGKFEIVDYDQKYFGDLLAIEKENFKAEVTGDEPWSEEILKQVVDNKNNVVILAILNDELAGYAVGELTDELNLSRVAVKEEFQNHGIATKLIGRLSDLAVEKGVVLSLEVCEHNITAKKLYEKLGFEVRRVRKNYYKDGSSCLEMIKVG